MKIYLEWLSLPKAEFKILMFLLDTNQLSFSIESLINYFMIGKSSANTAKLKAVLRPLEEKGVIDLAIGETDIKASILPQKKEYIEIPGALLSINDFRKKCFSISIDWGTALQVLFAIIYTGTDYQRVQITELTGIDKKTVSRTATMLKRDFIDISHKVVKRKINGEWRNIRSHLEIGAFGLVRRE